MNFCHNCGGKLQENPKFCSHYGMKFNGSLATTIKSNSKGNKKF